MDKGVDPKFAFAAPRSLVGSTGAATGSPSVSAANESAGVKSDSLSLSFLISAYQMRGHEMANLDPLGLNGFRDPRGVPELDYKFHGFTDADLDRKLNLQGNHSSGGHTGFLDLLVKRKDNLTLREVITNLKETYCGSIGVEYMHMGSREKCNWIRNQVENPKWNTFTKEKKIHIYERLAYADHLEKYLGNKFNTAKRFGLEGGEACIAGLKAMIDRGSELGAESFVFGMPHRGRLNVLANVMRKPMPQIFKEFQGTHYDLEDYMRNDWSASGDVKYHLGTSVDRTYPDGRKVHMALVANPSHLEAVNPVVMGKVRAKQFFSGNKDADMTKHVPVLLHGDAAFAGQGVVYECFQLQKVEEYSVGGTVHLIVNNQVGFTTDPINSRSTMYCSDLGKAFSIPIFHCNGDDPLAVVTAFEMAIEWRQQFKEDCIIDFVCYRRYGHNELDQPMYTQPALYKKIATHPDTLSVFEKYMLSSGTATQEEMDKIKTGVTQQLDKDFEKSKTASTEKSDTLGGSKWKGFKSPRQKSRIQATGYDLEKLRDIGLKMSRIPKDFNLHMQLKKIFAAREKSIVDGKDIDWGTAEALAFGTLLMEGNHVRLSGQDVQRGTFSHRHAVVIDQKTGQPYTPLNHLASEVGNQVALAGKAANKNSDLQAEFVARNSILSEYGVLGFETGYSLENPNTLVLWEAQFGDFVNGAQIMIDQFISAGEDKWLRQSGLTMLLPHGYMGQGAEHSSCRMERFLQQVDEDPDVVPDMNESERMVIQQHNWQVVNPSTPANYFHALRRQIHREFRKPLVLIAPKNLLRDRRCTSTLEDMAEGTKFKRVLREQDPEIYNKPEGVKRVVFCTGKIYYELLEQREKLGTKDTVLCRIEQLAPFPWDKVAAEVGAYPNAEVFFCQEEPKNMGAWSFVQPRIAAATKHFNNGKEMRPSYIGRKPAAATATGLGGRAHTAEQEAIISAAFTATSHSTSF
jgi:2-oxoglutarate dehydrogenase E1 component